MNKTGTISTARADVGIVTGPDAAVAYAVLAEWDEGRDPRDQVLADMAAIGHLIRSPRDGRLSRRRRVRTGQSGPVTFPTVACPSGLRSTPRKRVRAYPLRGFKSHRHRRMKTPLSLGFQSKRGLRSLVRSAVLAGGQLPVSVRLAESIDAGESTWLMANAAAPITPARPPAREVVMVRCSVASGSERL